MALFEMSYFSKALQTTVSLNVLMPERSDTDSLAGIPDGSFKTLYLLHGLRGDRNAWMRNTAIERYAEKYGIAVIMPEVGRSWYTDTQYGAKYFTFITDELPQVCQGYFKGLSSKREDNFIIGLSMGGYGAIKAALTYPERYFGCASLSGSLDITRRGRPVRMDEWKSIFDYEMTDPTSLDDTAHDLFYLAKRNRKNGNEFPKMFLWCGTEDVLITVNRQYHDLLNELEVEHYYAESEGDHTWQWWDLHIRPAIEYLLKE